MTEQLISPAANTRWEVLHVKVLLRPGCWGPLMLAALPLAASNELWHTVATWHTLHPVPDHPAGHAHADVETLPNEVADASGTNGRCAAWKMLPPQAGAEQVGPPKPGGQAQAEELMGTP